MILKNILNGTLQIEILLIKDDSKTSGLYILKEILTSLSNRNNKVHYFSYESCSNSLVESINDLRIYDCFSLNCPWFQQDALQNDSLYPLADTLIKDVPTDQQVFVLDSLNCLLLRDGIHKVSKLIDKLSSVKYKSGVPTFPVIMILHDFNVENLIHRQLERMSNILMKVSSVTNQDNLTLSVVHKKTSGKQIAENYSCCLESGSSKFNFIEIKEEVAKPTETEETNMAELTTFKLTLEDKEIESRNKLVLPYTREQEKKGKIFYEPDANDDWDDEDPDDDLEI